MGDQTKPVVALYPGDVRMRITHAVDGRSRHYDDIAYCFPAAKTIPHLSGRVCPTKRWVPFYIGLRSRSRLLFPTRWRHYRLCRVVLTECRQDVALTLYLVDSELALDTEMAPVVGARTSVHQSLAC